MCFLPGCFWLFLYFSIWTCNIIYVFFWGGGLMWIVYIFVSVWSDPLVRLCLTSVERGCYGCIVLSYNRLCCPHTQSCQQHDCSLFVGIKESAQYNPQSICVTLRVYSCNRIWLHLYALICTLKAWSLCDLCSTLDMNLPDHTNYFLLLS